MDGIHPRRHSARWGSGDDIRRSWQSNSRLSNDQRRDMNNHFGFGIQPWAPSVTDLDNAPPKSSPGHLLGNLIYSVLVGVPLGMVFCVAGLLTALSVVGCGHAMKCFRLAGYIAYPFRKVLLVRTGAPAPSDIEQLKPKTRSRAISASTYGEETPLRTFPPPSEPNASMPVITSEDMRDTQKITAGSVAFFILAAPILTLVMAVYAAVTAFLAFSSPISDLMIEMLKHVVWGDAARSADIDVISMKEWKAEKRAREQRHKLHNLRREGADCSAMPVPDVDEAEPVLIEIIAAGGLAYLGRSFYGVNVLLCNLMLFVPVNFVFYFVMSTHWVEDNSIMVMVCGLLSLVPLSYFIGHSVASIAAQTSFFVGAVLNATFGSLIELIIYYMALIKGLHELVIYATTGALLACLLLLPGLSMLFGGMYYKEQRFNQKAGQVSAIMMFVAIAGLLTPSMFYSVNSDKAMKCSDCTVSEEGVIDCGECAFTSDNFTNDTLFMDSVRPMSYGVCALLLLCYLVGLVFALHTHSSIYDEEEEEEYEEDMRHPIDPRRGSRNSLAENPFSTEEPLPTEPRSSVHGGDHGGHGPVWSRNACVTILVVATGCFAVCSESLLGGLDPSLEKMGISESFAGLTIIAIVPCIAEFVNAIQFAMRDNIKLSLEIGNIAGIQMVLVQVPVLTIGSALMGKTTPDDGFVLLYPMMNVSSMFIATLVITYLLIDGTCNYFRGIALLVIYSILILMFYYKPESTSY
eukprot:TRINITY_DN33169_c0_g2_i1.p1 TRINITY_DN33169_c0_g2~~TRINITY_DN33169_c0_g2_i1.p1  ORF type:complete len:869 (+),score=338.46 TRINITY_DN33169_c0_g2_i1:370-2607(+)